MIIYTGGTFDILHLGHIRFLQSCNKLGTVVVALNTDDFVLRYKGKSCVYTYEERKQHLLDTGLVDRVIPNVSGEDSTPTILSIQPDAIVIGTDWATRDYYKQMGFTQSWLDKNNIVLLYTPYYPHISSSDIIKRIKNENLYNHS